MNEKKLYNRFQGSRYTRRAKRHADDPKYLERLGRHSVALSHLVKRAGEKVKTTVEYIFGKESDWGVRIQAIASLLYFISPLDFIPDMIPGVGYVEDLAILGMVAGMITSRIIRKEKEIKLDEILDSAMKSKQLPGKSGVKGRTGNILNVIKDAQKSIDTAAQEQIREQIRVRLIVVIISLSGALIAAVITLILKFKFQVI